MKPVLTLHRDTHRTLRRVLPAEVDCLTTRGIPLDHAPPDLPAVSVKTLS